MSGFKEDMARVQQLVGNAFTATGGLVALADGAQMQPTKLRKALEQTIERPLGLLKNLTSTGGHQKKMN